MLHQDFSKKMLLTDRTLGLLVSLKRRAVVHVPSGIQVFPSISRHLCLYGSLLPYKYSETCNKQLCIKRSRTTECSV